MTPTMTPSELEAITGYRRAAEQLRTLHANGFWRARLDRLGRVVLERPHYDAVCAGQDHQPSESARPAVRSVGWARAA